MNKYICIYLYNSNNNDDGNEFGKICIGRRGVVGWRGNIYFGAGWCWCCRKKQK